MNILKHLISLFILASGIVTVVEPSYGRSCSLSMSSSETSLFSVSGKYSVPSSLACSSTSCSLSES
ncbi:unnamed protein product [Callosobruchus maculatus]|uniref:Secreted protein n=1 Tax=Callosobruchus maculatus TaxID=64391 RepID=A0A653CBQ6_CALMS|nr:unnamed protein product [Callosobruchus maculatus]